MCPLTFRSRWTTLFWCRKETPSRICLISLFTSPSLKASSSRSDTHWLKISPPAALHAHTHTQRDGEHQSTMRTSLCKNIVDQSLCRYVFISSDLFTPKNENSVSCRLSQHAPRRATCCRSPVSRRHRRTHKSATRSVCLEQCFETVAQRETQTTVCVPAPSTGSPQSS